MKNITKGLILGLFTAVSLVSAGTVFAATPILSAYFQGSNNVQITVSNANSNSQIDLYFQTQGSSLYNSVTNVGRTDYNGYFTQSIALGSSAYNISQMYVIVGGLQSQTVTVSGGGGYYGGYNSCAYGNCNYGNISLSQTSLNLSSGQSSTVTIYNNTNYNYYGNYYISTNSNSNVASASISGNSVYVYANQSGSTTITVCQSGGNSGCASLYVTVGGGCAYGNCGTGNVWFSPSNPNLYVGQSLAISINSSATAGTYYGSTAYYVSTNSNPNVVSASVVGTVLNLYANQNGSSSITVCHSSLSYCGTLYVTVGGSGGCAYGNCTGTLTLSQTSLNINPSQTAYVGISYSGSSYNNYYISSNSNSSVASAYISGNQLVISGITAGSTTINVCVNNVSGVCASVYVTVGGSGCAYGNCTGNLSLSQNNLSLNTGQSASVTAYNYSGGSLYISTNSSPSVVSVSISGSVINFYGITNGSSTVTICASNSSQCASVYVTVGGGSYGGNTVNITDNIFSPKVLNIAVGTTVVWTNNGTMLHTVTADDNSFISDNISPGFTYSHTFYSAGTYAYHCNFHGGVGGSGMSGIIIVGSGSGTGLVFSQSSVTLGLNQNTNVSITGAGGYYVSANSNPGVVSASIAGSTVYLAALSSGTSTVTVCQALGFVQCGSIYVTVSGGGSSGTAIWFSQNSVNLSSGQHMSVTIYSNNYGGNYYVSSNSNASAVSANVVGNALNLIGQGTGSSTINVCQSNGSGCGSVYVTASGGSCGYYGCGYGGNLSLSQTSLNLSQGQSASVNIYGSGNYYISSNSNSAVASASLSGSVLNIYAGSTGSSTISVCQNTGSNCVSVYVTVGGYSYGGGGVNYPGGNVAGASAYQNGQLISESGTVYIVYKNTKTGFTSASVFTGLGFSFGNVVNVGYSNLLDSGYTVRTAAGAHPWGSWVKSGSTVYFVHEAGLIPVPDWSTFLNNGGQASLIVSANSYDFRLPILSALVTDDSRLH